MQSNLKKTNTINPPSLISSFVAGFNTVARNISLVVIPLFVDLYLWCGPHIKISRLIRTISESIYKLSGTENQETVQFIQTSREMWQWIGTRFNLFLSIRTYPVGVPSLMAGRLPIETPQGVPVINWETSNLLMFVGLWFIVSLFGLGLGTVYFHTVSVASRNAMEDFTAFIRSSVKQYTQVVWLTLIWLVLILLVSLPAVCIISLLALGNPSLGQIAMLLYGGGVVWLLFPLLFSPHGIFIKKLNVLQSLRHGVTLTRMTLPTTGFLFLAFLIISQGLDLLWSSPAENSWFSIIGIAGHAFISVGLLATSFIYYEKADQWSQKILTQQITPSTHQQNAV